jgi:FtsZ-interacting cell division protein ZipA
VGIAVGAVVLIGIIVAVCFRATRSSRKEKYKKSSEFQSQSSEQGPAPLPLGYKKPVDLLQVAEQNRRIEEAEEKQRIQQQYKNNPNASYQTNQTNGYVSVPLSQVYVVAQSSPNRQNLAPGSFPAQYVDPGQQFSASYGYPGNFCNSYYRNASASLF